MRTGRSLDLGGVGATFDFLEVGDAIIIGCLAGE